MRKPMIGVIGSSSCRENIKNLACEVGREIAQQDCLLICGGLRGVMEAASRGAKEAGGITIGILPGNTKNTANPYIDIPIVTNIGYARNAIIALTADVLIAVSGGYGTMSEIAFGLKSGKPVFGINTHKHIPGVIYCTTPREAVLQAVKSINRTTYIYPALKRKS